MPTFTVQASPSGATAALAPSMMTGEGILNIGSTGSGGTVDDVLTAVGGTGTPATITIGGVSGLGCITSHAISNPGSYAVPPPTPVSFVGDTGTGYLFKTTATPGADLFMISAAQYAASGSGFVIGNVVRPTGDTGTEPTFMVATVTPQGGIMQPVTLGSLGAVSALPTASNYHAMSSGAGTGASLGVGLVCPRYPLRSASDISRRYCL